MGRFHFGVANRRVTKAEMKRFEAAAAKHDAEFNCVAGKQGHCVCGWGCRLDECPIKHIWFSTDDRGEPHNRNLARAVEAEIEANK